MDSDKSEQFFGEAYDQFKELIHDCDEHENVMAGAEAMIHANDTFKENPKWRDIMWENIYANMLDVTTN